MVASAAPPTHLTALRHTCAHILAMAIQQIHPTAKLATGPWTETGFYYDVELSTPLTPADLKVLETRMRQIVQQNLPIIREVVDRADIQAELQQRQEHYKLAILERIPEDELITRYYIGNPDTGRWSAPTNPLPGSLFAPYALPVETTWWDLCEGPHLDFTGQIDPGAFALEAVAGVYWQGQEQNPQLQRIYGTAWATAADLTAYRHQQEEAAKRDHRKLGQDLDLFSIEEAAGGGLVFWHPQGARMRLVIEDYWRQQHRTAGYELIYTPHIANLELWKTSGHFEFYRDSMFESVAVEAQQYQIKPMNCPFHVLTYKHGLHSYRDLPLRYAELGTVYRYERSGTLHGLMRVRGFTQDDAHIFCRPDQVTAEILGILNLTEQVLSDFGFKNYEIKLSTRPDKSVGSDEIWELATQSLIEALKQKQWHFSEDHGGGAFYGPKIDLKIRDAIGRLWQCSTIQVDFNLPERFDLNYVDSQSQRQRPIMIHRAIFGSLERFFGILVENYAGHFPLWLAPTQLQLCPLSEEQWDYAATIATSLQAAGYRVSVDTSGERLGKQIRTAELRKIPLIGVVGRKEVAEASISLRSRSEGDLGALSLEALTQLLANAVRTQRLL